MSYGKFIGDLPKALKRYIIAYDNLPNHEGCLLYVRGSRKVILDARVFDHDREALSDSLYEIIEGPPDEKLRITVEAGRLIVQASGASELDTRRVA
ncbi:hypothetical protein CSC67_08815 [Pusillimonas caeni]|uniref:hypothetical protein n=1 Tax=Pusillimonas caeni TaxID=1348472 RepID=UPI000E599CBD|nr:hypothetical protein [Pusillimonas caeni]TFL14244.1 hypothetical protein CSC67_08815 [Pusillimonas caeni]